MRRGELLALRWRDIDLERGIIAVRRSAGIVRLKGQPAVIRESDTKSMQSGTAAEARGQPGLPLSSGRREMASSIREVSAKRDDHGFDALT